MKIKIIVSLCCILLLIAAILYFVPWVTHVDISMDVMKLDDSRNIIGTEKIQIKGKKLNYLFREDRMVVEIAPFDQFMRIDKVNDPIIPQSNNGAFSVVLSAWANRQEDFLGSLCFSPDLQRWAITLVDDNGHHLYVGSVTGEHSADELLEYFFLWS